MYLIFDTSVLIDVEREVKEIMHHVSRLRELYPAPPKISFVTYYEFLYGTRKRNPKNRAQAEIFIDLFELPTITKSTARILARLKETYELPFADLLIAAQVIENDGILVTRDKDFERINELRKIVL